MKKPLKEILEMNRPRYNSTLGVYDARADRRDDPFSALPPGMSPQGFLEFLSEKWDLYGAFAYDCYQNGERGALIVDWDNTLLPYLADKNLGVHFRKDEVSSIWFGERMVKSMVEGKSLQPKWLKMIVEYNPKSMLVFGMHWGNLEKEKGFGNIMLRTLAIPNALSPYQAYLKNRCRLSEFTFSFGAAPSN